MKPKITMSEWTQALAEVQSLRADKVPVEFQTMGQIAEEIGKSQSHTCKLVRALHLKGLADRRMYRIALSDQVRPVCHYRLKKKL